MVHGVAREIPWPPTGGEHELCRSGGISHQQPIGSHWLVGVRCGSEIHLEGVAWLPQCYPGSRCPSPHDHMIERILDVAEDSRSERRSSRHIRNRRQVDCRRDSPQRETLSGIVPVWVVPFQLLQPEVSFQPVDQLRRQAEVAGLLGVR